MGSDLERNMIPGEFQSKDNTHEEQQEMENTVEEIIDVSRKAHEEECENERRVVEILKEHNIDDTSKNEIKEETPKKKMNAFKRFFVNIGNYIKTSWNFLHGKKKMKKSNPHSDFLNSRLLAKKGSVGGEKSLEHGSLKITVSPKTHSEGAKLPPVTMKYGEKRKFLKETFKKEVNNDEGESTDILYENFFLLKNSKLKFQGGIIRDKVMEATSNDAQLSIINGKAKIPLPNSFEYKLVRNFSEDTTSFELKNKEIFLEVGCVTLSLVGLSFGKNGDDKELKADVVKLKKISLEGSESEKATTTIDNEDQLKIKTKIEGLSIGNKGISLSKIFLNIENMKVADFLELKSGAVYLGFKEGKSNLIVLGKRINLSLGDKDSKEGFYLSSEAGNFEYVSIGDTREFSLKELKSELGIHGIFGFSTTIEELNIEKDKKDQSTNIGFKIPESNLTIANVVGSIVGEGNYTQDNSGSEFNLKSGNLKLETTYLGIDGEVNKLNYKSNTKALFLDQGNLKVKPNIPSLNEAIKDENGGGKSLEAIANINKLSINSKAVEFEKIQISIDNTNIYEVLKIEVASLSFSKKGEELGYGIDVRKFQLSVGKEEESFELKTSSGNLNVVKGLEGFKVSLGKTDVDMRVGDKANLLVSTNVSVEKLDISKNEEGKRIEFKINNTSLNIGSNIEASLQGEGAYSKGNTNNAFEIVDGSIHVDINGTTIDGNVKNMKYNSEKKGLSLASANLKVVPKIPLLGKALRDKDGKELRLEGNANVENLNITQKDVTFDKIAIGIRNFNIYDVIKADNASVEFMKPSEEIDFKVNVDGFSLNIEEEQFNLNTSAGSISVEKKGEVLDTTLKETAAKLRVGDESTPILNANVNIRELKISKNGEGTKVNFDISKVGIEIGAVTGNISGEGDYEKSEIESTFNLKSANLDINLYGIEVNGKVNDLRYRSANKSFYLEKGSLKITPNIPSLKESIKDENGGEKSLEAIAIINKLSINSGDVKFEKIETSINNINIYDVLKIEAASLSFSKEGEELGYGIDVSKFHLSIGKEEESFELKTSSGNLNVVKGLEGLKVSLGKTDVDMRVGDKANPLVSTNINIEKLDISKNEEGKRIEFKINNTSLNIGNNIKASLQGEGSYTNNTNSNFELVNGSIHVDISGTTINGNVKDMKYNSEKKGLSLASGNLDVKPDFKNINTGVEVAEGLRASAAVQDLNVANKGITFKSIKMALSNLKVNDIVNIEEASLKLIKDNEEDRKIDFDIETTNAELGYASSDFGISTSGGKVQITRNGDGLKVNLENINTKIYVGENYEKSILSINSKIDKLNIIKNNESLNFDFDVPETSLNLGLSSSVGVTIVGSGEFSKTQEVTKFILRRGNGEVKVGEFGLLVSIDNMNFHEGVFKLGNANATLKGNIPGFASRGDSKEGNNTSAINVTINDLQIGKNKVSFQEIGVSLENMNIKDVIGFNKAEAKVSKQDGESKVLNYSVDINEFFLNLPQNPFINIDATGSIHVEGEGNASKVKMNNTNITLYNSFIEIKTNDMNLNEEGVSFGEISGKLKESVPYLNGLGATVKGLKVSKGNERKITYESIEVSKGGELSLFEGKLKIRDLKTTIGNEFSSFEIGGGIEAGDGANFSIGANSVNLKMLKENKKFRVDDFSLDKFKIATAIGGFEISKAHIDDSEERAFVFEDVNVNIGEKDDNKESPTEENKTLLSLGESFKGFEFSLKKVIINKDGLKIPPKSFSFKKASLEKDFSYFKLTLGLGETSKFGIATDENEFRFPKNPLDKITREKFNKENCPDLLDLSTPPLGFPPLFSVKAGIRAGAQVGGALAASISLDGSTDDKKFKASLDKASIFAAAKLEAYGQISIGDRNIFQIYGEIKGGVYGSLGASLSGAIGLNYNRNDAKSKFKLDKEATRLDYIAEGSLKLKITADIGVAAFRIFNKKLKTWNLVEKEIAGFKVIGGLKGDEKGKFKHEYDFKFTSDLKPRDLYDPDNPQSIFRKSLDAEAKSKEAEKALLEYEDLIGGGEERKFLVEYYLIKSNDLFIDLGDIRKNLIDARNLLKNDEKKHLGAIIKSKEHIEKHKERLDTFNKFIVNYHLIFGETVSEDTLIDKNITVEEAYKNFIDAYPTMGKEIKNNFNNMKKLENTLLINVDEYSLYCENGAFDNINLEEKKNYLSMEIKNRYDSINLKNKEIEGWNYDIELFGIYLFQKLGVDKNVKVAQKNDRKRSTLIQNKDKIDEEYKKALEDIDKHTSYLEELNRIKNSKKSEEEKTELFMQAKETYEYKSNKSLDLEGEIRHVENEKVIKQRENSNRDTKLESIREKLAIEYQDILDNLNSYDEMSDEERNKKTFIYSRYIELIENRYNSKDIIANMEKENTIDNKKLTNIESIISKNKKNKSIESNLKKGIDDNLKLKAGLACEEHHEISSKNSTEYLQNVKSRNAVTNVKFYNKIKTSMRLQNIPNKGVRDSNQYEISDETYKKLFSNEAFNQARKVKNQNKDKDFSSIIKEYTENKVKFYVERIERVEKTHVSLMNTLREASTQEIRAQNIITNLRKIVNDKLEAESINDSNIGNKLKRIQEGKEFTEKSNIEQTRIESGAIEAESKQVRVIMNQLEHEEDDVLTA